MNKKNRKSVLLLLSFPLFLNFSEAVTVRNCPAKINVKIDELEVNANKNEALKDFSSLNLATATLEEKYEDKEYLSAELAYETLDDGGATFAEWSNRTFAISKRENGVCRYTSQENPYSEEKIEIYTSNQKDRIYLQTLIGPRGTILRTYAVLNSLTTTSVTVEAGPYGAALGVPRSNYTSYSAGGPLGFVAKAGKFEVNVIE